MQTLNGYKTKKGLPPSPPYLSLPPPQIPLPEPCGVKRQRGDIEYGDSVDLNSYVDVLKVPYATDRCVNSLSCEELKYARLWASQRIEKCLYIDDIMLPKSDEEYSFMWPKRLHNQELQWRNVENITALYASEPRTRIQNLEVPKKIEECMTSILMSLADASAMEDNDVEGLKMRFETVLDPLVKLLSSAPAVLPCETHEIWRTIVTLNRNDETATIIPSANVRYPTPRQEDLLRDTMLLLPIANRHLAQYLLSFACHISRTAPAPYQSAAKKTISEIIGPQITSSPNTQITPTSTPRKSKKPTWPAYLFELLMYAGDRHTNSADILQRDCRLWRIPEDLALELSKHTSKTPFPTPKRRVSSSVILERRAIDKEKRNTCRKLFDKETSPKKTVMSMRNWVSVNREGQTVESRCVVLDREMWCKRRRVDRTQTYRLSRISIEFT
ncbi:uncharacterized protein SPPG_03130 [Spizellomyces punctatus DAOM BR117]|uniref:Uncharacterized protein n=1 Tax=Spizellomyces punctatus (strain DAOM BR117) TaxID=645134 RepID=A0A0L0HJV3_SPIPD|nr:uncharacterized protein SPPG_03130 [Spizellomyces punctatus DAOM BR117]KND01318.1 hypothetical protein SPPG_03130 [Spizellomyces punctatus DAOM BR117]|eukprot:XP_016609357.1 hypothetical protein SPPG_03130 [Spizellomyces punctatus DAOM BR117]